MEHAKRLLQQTDYTLDTISLATAYSTAFSFSRAFKRVEGVSPAVFRRRFQERR
jgi:AraC-like DNA-binding protein